MRGMIILQGDEEGKDIFMDVFYKKNVALVFGQRLFNEEDSVIDEALSSRYFQSDYFLIATGIDCKTTQYLQDYYPFYVVKIIPLAYKIVSNYKNGRFLLGCKSDSFESDVNEVLRLVSI